MLVVLGSLLCAAQDAETYEFTGMLSAVGQMQEYSGELLAIDRVDLRWFIQFDVLKVAKGKCPGMSGKVVAYAIHSPSTDFAADVSEENLKKSFEISGVVRKKDGIEIRTLRIRPSKR